MSIAPVGETRDVGEEGEERGALGQGEQTQSGCYCLQSPHQSQTVRNAIPKQEGRVSNKTCLFHLPNFLFYSAHIFHIFWGDVIGSAPCLHILVVVSFKACLSSSETILQASFCMRLPEVLPLLLRVWQSAEGGGAPQLPAHLPASGGASLEDGSSPGAGHRLG